MNRREELKKELNKELADLINPIGQQFETSEISEKILEFFSHRIENFDRKINFIKPSIDELKSYMIEKDLADEFSITHLNEVANEFFNYYESCGWLVGKSKKPMVNWRKSLDGWLRRSLNKKTAKVDQSVKAFIGIQQLKEKK